MSDDQTNGSGLRQSHHGNYSVVTAMFSMDVKVALITNTHKKAL